ncbi:hypothetical protein EYF80_001659 [Liparis tanakae]|uniref:Uncharacterized protein n=1 Tax=Liparis tanakae TaxID=230148 RepID=A0A4Z2JEK3_9TELE|nr:hypothetical protein EYF80_001659 [Liparis tanakae]
MDLARVLTVRVWRGAFTFKPDSLAAISLSGDQLAARTDPTRDTDAVSPENVLTDDPDLSWKHKWAPEEQTQKNIVASLREKGKSEEHMRERQGLEAEAVELQQGHDDRKRKWRKLISKMVARSD